MTQTCVQHDCTGRIDDDGYCDICGRRGAAVPPVAEPGPDAVSAGDIGGVSGGDGCGRPGCTGRVVDGFCDFCGMAPRRADVPADPPVGEAPPTPDTGTVGWSPRTQGSAPRPTAPSGGAGRGNLGAGLVEVPALPAVDPLAAVLVDPEVPERKRMCAVCDEPVGRTRGEVPGRTEGFCTHCGNPFSFTPKLGPGELVGGQYLVEGCLAHGGMGWVYLARDRNVSDKWVVLKGLLDSGDASAMAAADAERRFLAEIEHPNIVKIFNFVQHGGAGYIVMEYVGGLSLREIRNQHRKAHDAPLPVAQACAYVLEILPAFGFLHGRGLLYCDFKPDNAIQVEEQLKLIDLGGVRAMDDDESDLYGTIGYQAPEVPDAGASVASDLYTVARTLAVLALDIPGLQDPALHATSLPSPAEAPVLRRYEAFHDFLLKGAAADPAARFASAADMADQLRGVLRQVVAVDGGSPPAAPSRLFSAELGQGPVDEGWRHLPVPAVDPFDPVAGLLASAAGYGPEQLVTVLAAAPPSAERAYQLARARLDLGDPAGAERELDTPAVSEGGWPTAWWRGIFHLATGDPRSALPYVSVVARELPGELAPRLAGALAWELVAVGSSSAGAASEPGDAEERRSALTEAGRRYELVASTDASFVGACFGLSRVRAGLGDRDGALDALRLVPGSSSSHQSAQLELVRLCCRPIEGRWAPVPTLAAGSLVLSRLAVEPSVRLPLVRDLLAEALEQLCDGRAAPDAAVLVADTPFVEEDLRLALETTYRALAKLASTAGERRRLVDGANAARPRTRT